MWLRLAVVIGVAGVVSALALLVGAPWGAVAARTAGDHKAPRDAPRPSPRKENVEPAQVAVVGAEQAAIRGQPSASSPAVCLVPEGTQLLVDDAQGPWCRVRMDQGPACYIARGSVRLTAVYVIEDVPAPNANGRPDVVAAARRHLGTRYVWGGTTWRGMDCSGFVRAVLAACGTQLPRSAAKQARVGAVVLGTGLQPGDRLYFGPRAGSIDHTGLYIGDGAFIHASSRHGQVVISRLDDPYYVRRYAFARR